MSAPDTNGGDATPGGHGPNTTDANLGAGVDLHLSELKELCHVLGINVAGRLRVLGIKEGLEVPPAAHTSLVEDLVTLRGIKDTRFKTLTADSKTLIGLWKKSFRALGKSVDLNILYALADAKSVTDIKSENYLSSTLLDQVQKEIKRFGSEAEKKQNMKIKARNKKLMDMLKSSHLSHINVHFDPDEQAFPDEAWFLKDKIKELKPIVLQRKELIFRVDQVITAINEAQSTKSIEAHLGRARKAADELISSVDEVVLYDGHEIHLFLDKLGALAISLHQDLEELPKKAAGKTRTRSGSRIKDSAQGTSRQQGCEGNMQINEDDWITKDRKRIVYLAFNVLNLESTIECYTTCFGMQLLREFQHNDVNCALLGYDLEKTNFQLIYRPEEDGVPERSIGHGFGQVSLTNADVIKFAKTAEGSPVCKMVHQPCWLKGCSTTIAFASDPNGVLFELIQSDRKYDPVCRILLYAGDLDLSIEFYQKALGMRVLKKAEYETYKMVVLGFDAEDKATVLELRTNNGAKQIDLGAIYHQIVIETADVFRSSEILKKVPEAHGGKILQEPGPDSKVCSFEDPDGWRWVLVDSSVPDKAMVF